MAIAKRYEGIANMKETGVSVESLNQRYKYVQSLSEHLRKMVRRISKKTFRGTAYYLSRKEYSRSLCK